MGSVVRMTATYTRGFGALVSAFLLCVPGGAAQEIEEILEYDVTIVVERGGGLLVTETLEVVALGQEIRRGIYRDFPTTFPRLAGLGRIEAPFEVQSVARDGVPEPYSLSSIGDGFGRSGVRVRIGDPDVYLEPGRYRYDLVYRTDRWIHFGEESDELYWNVTGNGWDFPIRNARAFIQIMEAGGTPALSVEAWTGPDGSTASNATAEWQTFNRAGVFETTRPLARREGLTIRVVMPTGIIVPPSTRTLREWFWLDWGGYVDGALAVLLVIGIYALMWLRVGRDPAARHVVVQYEPPEGYSPAALGYLRERGFEHRQFAATLVSLATHGYVDIEQKKKKSWTVHRVAGRQT